MPEALTAKVNGASTRIPLLVGDTPLVSVRVRTGHRTATLHLKLESFNPCGSIKDRTAVSLFESIMDKLDPDVGVVESTSGNLGVALAAIAQAHRVPFTAVIDPRTPQAAVHELHRARARVEVVTDDDGRGGFLLSRLTRVRQLLHHTPTLCWTNQYENPANPRAHEWGTAPELARQIKPTSTVLAPVSTGGTLAGMRAFAARGTRWNVIGVDVLGSYALGHQDGERILPGIGSSRESSFVTADDGPVMRIGPGPAVAACVWLLEQADIGVGASSGALIAAALRLIVDEGLDDVVCLCADGARNYLTTVYSPAWRTSRGLTHERLDAACESVEWNIL